MPKAGIYIHIPFCRVKCIYCDFYSVAAKEEFLTQFISALVHEIHTCAVDTSRWTFDTIFIGGGTPSLLSASQLHTILHALHSKFNLSHVKEISLEINPGATTSEALADYHALGINRLSIGIQSLEPALLQWLSRIHTVQESYQTYREARKAGFDNINCDLLYGIPGQSLTIWERDLKRLLELHPDHISAYALTVENGTPLHQLVRIQEVTMPTEKQTALMFRSTHALLNSEGYQHYEISNFALPERTCFHNRHYWNIDPYLGFGPSAHGFDGTTRWWNISSLNIYLERISKGQSPIANQERLNKIQLLNEIIGFGLRTCWGVDLHRIPEPFRQQLLNRAFQGDSSIKPFLCRQKNHLAPTPEGMLYADALAVDLTFSDVNQ